MKFVFIDNSIEQQQVSLPEKGCMMAGQLFPPGASWHPYLPPKGFDTCIVCTCNVSIPFKSFYI
jgi:chordin